MSHLSPSHASSRRPLALWSILGRGRARAILILAIGILAGHGTSAFAQLAINWLGNDSGVWTDKDNWSTGAVPTSSSAIYFKKSTLSGKKTTTINLGDTDRQVDQIRFYGNQAFTLTSSTATTEIKVGDGGILNNTDTGETVPSSVTNIINLKYAAVADQTIDARDAGLTFQKELWIGSSVITFRDFASGVTTVNGPMTSGNGQSMFKAGDGLLRLLGANTFNADMVIQGGTVEIAADSGLGTAPSSADANRLTFDAGTGGTGTLNTTATMTLNSNRGVTLTSGTGNFDVDAGTTLSYGGIITGSGNLSKSDTGTMILTGANNYTGTTTINGGTLQVGDGGSTGTLGTGNVTNNGALVFNTSSSNLTQSSVISGNGTLTKSGSGNVTLSGNNTYTGTTTVSSNGGVLIAASNNALGSTTSGTVVNAFGALGLQGNITIGAEALSLTGSGFGGNGALINLSGNNTYQGAITLTGNTEIDTNAGSLTLSNTITGTNTTLDIDAFTGSNLTISNTVNLGSGGLHKQESGGTVTLSGSSANAYTGNTSVDSGTLSLNKTAGVNATGTGSLIIGNGSGAGNSATVILQANSQINDGSAVTINSDGKFDLNSKTETVGSIAGSGNITLGTGALTAGGDNTSTTFSGIMSGNGTFTKNGTGTTTLSGANSYTGATTVNAGILSITNNTALGTTAGSTSVASGATLAVSNNITVGAESLTVVGTGSGGGGALRNLSGNNTYGGTITLGGNTTIASDAGTLTATNTTAIGGNTLTVTGAGNTTLSGPITGTSASQLTKTGTGTLALGSANSSFAGAVLVSAGTVIAKAANVFNSANAITVETGSILNLNNLNQTIKSITSNGTLALGSGTGGSLTLTSGESFLGGALTGSGTIIIGPGATLTLGSDFNDPNANIIIAGGTLKLNGTSTTFGSLSVTATGSVIDFGNGSNSTINTTSLTVGVGSALTVNNWTHLSDYFYTQNFTDATKDVTGTTPENRITFTGFSANQTVWQAYDNQVLPILKPVPEPSTYGAIFVGSALGFILWRRRNKPATAPAR